jgi:hypothetical protein
MIIDWTQSMPLVLSTWIRLIKMWYWIVGRNAPSRSIQRKAGGKKDKNKNGRSYKTSHSD